MTLYRIAFAGTPSFALPSIEAIYQHPNFDLVCVITQPNKPSGRGQRNTDSPVKHFSKSYKIPLIQPSSINSEESQKTISNLSIDFLIVVAFGQILTESILKIPKMGCINLHASLLPRWRGAAPIQRSIAAGDKKTGVSVISMNSGLDSGVILASDSVDIDFETTSGELHKNLASIGSKILVDTLLNFDKKTIFAVQQNPDEVTFAKKITRLEAQINWQLPSEEISRHIHAFSPIPGAFSHWNRKRIKFLRVKAQNKIILMPGEMRLKGKEVFVGTGTKALIVKELQLEGGIVLNQEKMRISQNSPWFFKQVLTNFENK